MIDIELTEEEADVLLRELDRVLSDTRMEISATHHPTGDYREAIKHDKAVLEHIIAQLRAEIPVAS